MTLTAEATKEEMVSYIQKILANAGWVTTKKAISAAFKGRFLSANSRALYGLYKACGQNIGWAVRRLRNRGVVFTKEPPVRRDEPPRQQFDFPTFIESSLPPGDRE